MLLLAGFAVQAQQGLAQTPAAQPAQASSHSTASVVANPARTSKAKSRKSVPVAAIPQTPTPPPTLEQQPPVAPQVSYLNGQLTIDSQNATLSQVLRSVQTQTGASIDIPPGAGSERVVARLGPGKPKDVLSALLNGSKFNYVILGESNNSGGVQKVILLAKSSSAGEPAPVMTGQNNFRAPPSSQAVEPPEDEYPQNEPDSEVQLVPGQPGMPGSDGLQPDAANAAPGQFAPGNRTPEQMLQELQRLQMQQQQLQQQLNPSNQQQSPFPSQPAPAPQSQ